MMGSEMTYLLRRLRVRASSRNSLWPFFSTHSISSCEHSSVSAAGRATPTAATTNMVALMIKATMNRRMMSCLDMIRVQTYDEVMTWMLQKS